MRDLRALSANPEESGIPQPGEKVGTMIRCAIQSLLEADAKLAEHVLALDDEIDDMNRDVQTELVDVMRQHPTVSGQALNAIIISRNLERVGDHATNIAEDVIFWVRGADVRHGALMNEEAAEDDKTPTA